MLNKERLVKLSRVPRDGTRASTRLLTKDPEIWSAYETCSHQSFMTGDYMIDPEVIYRGKHQRPREEFVRNSYLSL
jgi:hypothetical protein